MEPNMYEPGVVAPQKQEEGLVEMEKSCNKYRGFMLLGDKLLLWEPPYVPAVAIAVVTVVFAITWYIEPSVITSLSFLGILVCFLEFASPFVSDHFYKQPEQWDVLLKEKYSKVCERILSGKEYLKCCCGQVCKMKAEKPNSFLLLVIALLLLTAWVGSFVDPLLLAYLFVVVLVLIPGLKKHGVVKKVTDLVKSKLNKPKAN